MTFISPFSLPLLSPNSIDSSRFYVKYFLFLNVLSIFLSINPNNPVDHKNLQLSLYLDLIKYNTQEKLGILPYILKYPQGIYLEVGTGGDPIADLLSQIPDDMSPTVIASDVDQAILDVLPSRHPQLNKYLNGNGSGPQLKLQQLDATAMGCFPDNYLSGINASAVVHEIISYAGGLQGLHKFFSESLRILKPDGVLIYRDPEGVTHSNELVRVELNTSSIKLFVHIFLVKFLDNRYGKFAQSGRKIGKYNTQDITFIVYKKNDKTQHTLSYDQYFQLPSHAIDFARPYAICVSRGLCREIERHYLTYLHQCNPLVFVKCLPDEDSKFYFVHYLAHGTKNILKDFLDSNGKLLTNETIDMETKNSIDSAIVANTQVLEYGIPLYVETLLKKHMLFDILSHHGIDIHTYLHPMSEICYSLDYRIYGLLYDYLKECDISGLEHNMVHAAWLKREGEESYVYYSDDELITQAAEISLEQNQTEQDPYVLCPVSPAHTIFVPRLCYNELLKDSLDIYSTDGFPIMIKEGKRIIHFIKLPLSKALPIFADIIKANPDHYQKLSEWIKHLAKQRAIA